LQPLGDADAPEADDRLLPSEHGEREAIALPRLLVQHAATHDDRVLAVLRLRPAAEVPRLEDLDLVARAVVAGEPLRTVRRLRVLDDLEPSPRAFARTVERTEHGAIDQPSLGDLPRRAVECLDGIDEQGPREDALEPDRIARRTHHLADAGAEGARVALDVLADLVRAHLVLRALRKLVELAGLAARVVVAAVRQELRRRPVLADLRHRRLHTARDHVQPQLVRRGGAVILRGAEPEELLSRVVARVSEVDVVLRLRRGEHRVDRALERRGEARPLLVPPSQIGGHQSALPNATRHSRQPQSGASRCASTCSSGSAGAGRAVTSGPENVAWSAPAVHPPSLSRTDIGTET